MQKLGSNSQASKCLQLIIFQKSCCHLCMIQCISCTAIKHIPVAVISQSKHSIKHQVCNNMSCTEGFKMIMLYIFHDILFFFFLFCNAPKDSGIACLQCKKGDFSTIKKEWTLKYKKKCAFMLVFYKISGTCHAIHPILFQMKIILCHSIPQLFHKNELIITRIYECKRNRTSLQTWMKSIIRLKANLLPAPFDLNMLFIFAQ